MARWWRTEVRVTQTADEKMLGVETLFVNINIPILFKALTFRKE